jgi:hypothetical protein
MNSIPPAFCSLLLVAMVAAGVSHHWSVETLLSQHPNIQDTPLAAPVPLAQKKVAGKAPKKSSIASSVPSETKGNPSKEEFFNTLIAELRNLKNENRNLRDQMGETNRDVMKLAFRVDTHSESFRPLPTPEQRDDTSFNFDEEYLPGVLPPRAKPVVGGID